MATSNTRIANEAWEALFRAQMTIVRELEAGDVWGDLVPREYGVLYALSVAPDGLRITELLDDVLLTQTGMSRAVHSDRHVAAARTARGPRTRGTGRRPGRRTRLPRAPHRGRNPRAARGRPQAR